MSCVGCMSGPSPGSGSRWYNPSPTVRSPRTPLYQLGWLGQDEGEVPVETVDTGGDYIPPVTESTVPVYASPLPDQIPYLPPASIPSGTTPDTTNTGGGIPGAPSITSQLTQAISSIFAPSPKVPVCVTNATGTGCTPQGALQAPGMTATIGQALPYLALGGLALIVLTSLGGGGRRRR
jgi:hypothetical protein